MSFESYELKLRNEETKDLILKTAKIINEKHNIPLDIAIKILVDFRSDLSFINSKH